MNTEWPDIIYEDVLDADIIEDEGRIPLLVGRGALFLLENETLTPLGEVEDLKLFWKGAPE